VQRQRLPQRSGHVERAVYPGRVRCPVQLVVEDRAWIANTSRAGRGLAGLSVLDHAQGP
jgi:hypothetical protein